jgi:prolyl-tRNA synthetase
MKLDELIDNVEDILLKQQKDLFEKNKAFREANTYYVNTYDEFKEKIEKGFIFAHWDGTAETANKIQEETKATIRCIPNE